MKLDLDQAPQAHASPARPRRIVILSDTHLSDGRRGAGSVEALRPLWQGADRLIFNGDTVEMRSPRTRDAAHQRLEELQQLTAADGVELTLIAGNHDPFVSELDWLEVVGGAVVLMHGDLLHPAVRPWAEAVAWLRADRDHQAELHANASAEPCDHDEPSAADFQQQLAATKRAAVREWREANQARFEAAQLSRPVRWWRKVQRLSRAWFYWTVFPGRAHRFAEEEFPRAQFVVFGHIHTPGDWVEPNALGPVRDRVVIYTGSFYLPPRPRAVVIEGRAVSFWKVRGSAKRGYRLAKAPTWTGRIDSDG